MPYLFLIALRNHQNKRKESKIQKILAVYVLVLLGVSVASAHAAEVVNEVTPVVVQENDAAQNNELILEEQRLEFEIAAATQRLSEVDARIQSMQAEHQKNPALRADHATVMAEHISEKKELMSQLKMLQEHMLNCLVAQGKVSKIKRFWLRHRKTILISAAVVGVLLLLTGGVYYYKKRQKEAVEKAAAKRNKQTQNELAAQEEQSKQDETAGATSGGSGAQQTTPVVSGSSYQPKSTFWHKQGASGKLSASREESDSSAAPLSQGDRAYWLERACQREAREAEERAAKVEAAEAEEEAEVGTDFTALPAPTPSSPAVVTANDGTTTEAKERAKAEATNGSAKKSNLFSWKRPKPRAVNHAGSGPAAGSALTPASSPQTPLKPAAASSAWGSALRRGAIKGTGTPQATETPQAAATPPSASPAAAASSPQSAEPATPGEPTAPPPASPPTTPTGVSSSTPSSKRRKTRNVHDARRKCLQGAVKKQEEKQEARKSSPKGSPDNVARKLKF